MTAREFAEWQAYFTLHPFGPLMDDIRAARICASVANFSAAVDWKKRRDPFQPKDFLPQEKQAQTPDDQLKMAEALNAALGGVRKKKR